MTMTLYPYEDAELLTQEQAAEESAADAEYDAWLDELLSDVDLDAEAPYVPFQQPAEYYALAADESFDDQIGYMESVAPYLF